MPIFTVHNVKTWSRVNCLYVCAYMLNEADCDSDLKKNTHIIFKLENDVETVMDI